MRRLERDAWAHFRSAFLCTLLGNAFNREANLTIADFMPGERIAKQKQTPEQMLTIVKLYQKYFELKEKDGRR